MSVTNFTYLANNLYVLWDPVRRENVKAWRDIQDVPEEYKDAALVSRRIAITAEQYGKMVSYFNGERQ